MFRDNLIKKLIYKSNYRGSRENDKLLSLFAKTYLKDYEISQLELFQKFLEESDSNIFYWVTGKKVIPSQYNDKIIDHLLNFINLRNFDQ